MPIKTIKVEADYCFGAEGLEIPNLTKVNFIFAPNGSGKTTISRELAKQPEEPEQRRLWPVAPTTLPIRVFNEEYKSKIITDHVAGIFTLGEESKHTNEEISRMQQEKRDLRNQIESLKTKIGQEEDSTEQNTIYGSLSKLQNDTANDIFDFHKKHSQTLINAVFTGTRHNKLVFLDRAVEVFNAWKNNKGSTSWEDLENRANTLFVDVIERQLLPKITLESLIDESDRTLLNTDYKPSGEGPLTDFISSLKNAHWVDSGRQYLQQDLQQCPFCQQNLDVKKFQEDLEIYFSDSYDRATERCKELVPTISNTVERLNQQLAELKNAVENDKHINGDEIIQAIEHLSTKSKLLLSRVEEKLTDMSKSKQVDDIRDDVSSLNSLIEAENSDIEEHNRLVANQVEERKKLAMEGWKTFVADRVVNGKIRGYISQRKKKLQKIEDDKLNLSKLEAACNALEENIVQLRQSVHQTHEVANKINTLLGKLGFTRFRLQVEDDQIAGGYTIIREDGSTAHTTLSEGEKSFLAFAYFWESLFGTTSSEATAEDVVAVFDDPISSLDSDTLYIVAAHVRKAAKDAISKNSKIKQLIVLTHNTQFHHESSFAPRSSTKSYHFYRLVKSSDGKTTILRDDGHESRIKSNYMLLWKAIVETATIEDPTSSAPTGVYNIVRRIIENYFTWVGHSKATQASDTSGNIEDRLNSTFNIWANSGSHTIANDFDQSIHAGTVYSFLKAFKYYFDSHGHSKHFEMMIRANGGEKLLEPGAIFGEHTADITA